MYAQFQQNEIYPYHLIIELFLFLIQRAKSLEKKTFFKHLYNHLQENNMLSFFLVWFYS